MALFISHHNTKTAGFFPWNRHTCDGNVRVSGLVEVQHHFIVHLIDMVTAENQYIFRIIAFYVLHILENSVCCSRIPVRVFITLVWRQ